MTTTFEQRNPYQGDPARAWITLRLVGSDGGTREWKLIADTGSPFPFVIGPEELPDFSFGAGTSVNTNFGLLEAAWFRLEMPEFGLDTLMHGYVSAVVVASTKASHESFEGLAGLPLLRLLQYGGDEECFWIRRRSPAKSESRGNGVQE